MNEFIYVNTTAIEAYRKKLALQVALEFARISVNYQQLLRAMFTELVMGTPQWSGDLAANWNFSIGSPDTTYTELPDKQLSWGDKDFTPKSAGDPAAVQIALARMEAKIEKVTWRDRVHFTNSTPIAEAVEAQTVYIRPVNLLGSGGVAMLSYIQFKYGQMGSR